MTDLDGQRARVEARPADPSLVSRESKYTSELDKASPIMADWKEKSASPVPTIP